MTQPSQQIDRAHTRSAECSSCGAPCAIVLSASPHIACAACGFSGEPSAATAEAIVQAHRALQNVPLKARQLSATRRILILAPGRDGNLVRLWLAAGVPLLLAFLFGLAALSSGLSADDGLSAKLDLSVVVVTILPAVWPPFILHIALGWSLRHTLRTRAQELARDLWAHPAVGDLPASCRLCGAPIAIPLGRRHVVRCVHCATDNVVDAVLAQASAAHELHAFSEREASVAERTRAAGTRLERRVMACLATPLVLLALAAPLALFAHATLEQQQHTVSELNRYVLAPVLASDGLRPARSCVGERVRGHDADVVFQDGPASFDAATMRPLRLGDLIGREAVLANYSDPQVWRVERAYADGFGRERLVLRDVFSNSQEVTPRNVCLVVPP